MKKALVLIFVFALAAVLYTSTFAADVINDIMMTTEENSTSQQTPLMVIVSNSTPGIYDEGYYRNYYDVFNPYTGQKCNEIPGSSFSEAVIALETAYETGSFVELENGYIKENIENVPVIDTSDSEGGLVWISGFDAEESTICLVPMYVTESICCEKGYNRALKQYKFDEENPEYNFDGTPFAVNNGRILYKITDKTVVSLLDYSDPGEQTIKWGSFKLLDVSDIENPQNSIKCYNDTIINDGDFVTKYSQNLAAYVYTSDASKDIPQADFVIIVKNKLMDNQKGMFNKVSACETHTDAVVINSLTRKADNGFEMSVSNKAHSGTALLMICTYNSSGVLVNTYFKTSDAETGEDDTFATGAITDVNVVSAKAYVFDSKWLLTPLAKDVEL